MENSFNFSVIGHVHSPYREKFGAPRQSGLAQAALGKIVLVEPFCPEEAFARLDEFSHLWMVFVFHLVKEGDWKNAVRPPRLGGNQTVGVWASRSPFRPNRIGLSSAKIERIRPDEGVIEISGIDLVDGTPLLDLKPYVPYCDAIEGALPGYATTPEPAIADYRIVLSDAIAAAIDERSDGENFRRLLEQSLRADPRPAYHNDPDRVYGMALGAAQVRWRVTRDAIVIEEVNFTD